ncbi:Uncharacterised protein [uncultured archaeon]|nr:Uncharacterised protein [uncultured archaeon]
MKTLDELKRGDYIAFGFNYNGGKPNEIIVSCIEKVWGEEFSVSFGYNGRHLSEFVKKEKVLAIQDNEAGEEKIYGCIGKYCIINQKSVDKILAERF